MANYTSYKNNICLTCMLLKVLGIAIVLTCLFWELNMCSWLFIKLFAVTNGQLLAPRRDYVRLS